MTQDPLQAFDGKAFTTSAARRSGVGRRRLKKQDLHPTFRGVRAFREATTVRQLCDDYLPKMAAHEFFSHRTAAVLNRMWLPIEVETRLLVDVAVVPPHRAPRDARSKGHHLIGRPGLVMTHDGYRVSNPVETLCQLATMLREEDLVVAAESLLTPWHENRRSTYLRLMRACEDELRPCACRLARVAPRIRIGSRSAQESRMRLALVASGLPEPLINHRWQAPDGERFEGDLVYLEERIWIEVEGDQHRTDRKQWRKDLRRYERLTDLGWRVVRVSGDDVARPAETISRIRTLLIAASGTF